MQPRSPVFHQLHNDESILVNSSIGPLSSLSTLIDPGSNRSYISRDLVRSLNLKERPLDRSIGIINFDGSYSECVVTSFVLIDLEIEDHVFHDTLFLVTSLPPDNPIILGFDFADRNSLVISWATKAITFNRQASTHISDVIDPPLDFQPDWLDEIDYEPPSLEKAREIVPPEYHNCNDVFSKEKGESLPQHRPHDLTIDLIPGSVPPFGRIYRLAEREQRVLKEYIDDLLAKDLIQPSSSRAASPVLFVPKKGGELRLCVDYRKLNLMTIKDRYPIPSTDILLDQLSNAKIFTKIDLRWAYHRIRIAEGHERKTAFRTRYGLFEYKVMPFGLTNCPATFQRHVDSVLRPFVDRFVVVYLDDILIYSTSIDEHHDHIRQVLQVLRDNELYAKAEKCDFHRESVDYLGFHVSSKGITMDPKKVEDILNWNPPTTVRGVRGFLGFANFYRRFILDYAKIAKPLTNLTRKDEPFVWTDECQQTFESLKRQFTSAPILRHFQSHRETRFESDASDYAIGAVLLQLHDTIWHPVAFISRTLNSAERNYDTHD